MLRSSASFLVLAVLGWTWGASVVTAQEPRRFSSEGRLLYANDNDWDWASPSGAKEPSGLSVYGKMSWSALDWMEEGLTEVRGVLVGTPPETGGYLSLADLNKLRQANGKRSYEHIQHRAGILAELLKDKTSPNLIIMMTDRGPPKLPITEEDRQVALEFVRRGGRVMLLDDWKVYLPLMQPFLDPKNFPPPKSVPVVEELANYVQDRVALLDSPSFIVREKATAELVRKGVSVVPLLKDHQPQSLEQKGRIQQILEKLAPEPIPDNDPLLRAYKTARSLHRHCELRSILRNAQQHPGHAVCVRLPMVEEKK